MGMTGLCLSYLFFQCANGFAIVPDFYRRYGCLERTGFLDAPSLHVFQKLRPDFRFFDQVKNCLGLVLVDCSHSPVVIISDDYNIEDIADHVATQERIGAPRCLHLRLATRSVERRRHKGILIMPGWQMLKTAPDPDAA